MDGQTELCNCVEPAMMVVLASVRDRG